MRLIDMPGCGVFAIKTGRSLLEQVCASTVLGTGLVLLLSAAALAQEADPVGNALLPRDLSPWGMFKNADVVVQGVLVGLAIASVITWTVWLAKTLELWTAKRRLRVDLR
jgi:biopolymer transport protein ExbB